MSTRESEFLAEADAFIESRRDEWDLRGSFAFEAVNHLLRVWIQRGVVQEHRTDWLRVAELQQADGGWPDRSGDPASATRTTAFTTQMLLRANRVLDDPTVADAVHRGLHRLLAIQQPDGCWEDRRWPVLDATSVPIGTLLFATRAEASGPGATAALQRGMRWVLDARADDGLWYHKATASPVEITSHLLQKCVIYGNGAEVVRPAMRGLLDLQDGEGHWDHEDVDSTCDAMRCLMLAAQSSAGANLADEVHAAADRGIAWLMAIAHDGGYGARPGRTPNVLFTCDAVDTVLKFQLAYGDRGLLISLYH